MFKSLLTCIALIHFAAHANAIMPNAGMPIPVDGPPQELPVTHKECLFHDLMYEDYFILYMSDAPCSFDISGLDLDAITTAIHPEAEPHNPDCFSERYTHVN